MSFFRVFLVGSPCSLQQVNFLSNFSWYATKDLSSKIVIILQTFNVDYPSVNHCLDKKRSRRTGKIQLPLKKKLN